MSDTSKPVWIACRVEQRDGSTGCGGTTATLLKVIPVGQQPGAALGGIAGQAVQKTFEGLIQGRLVRYRCTKCNGTFSVRQ